MLNKQVLNIFVVIELIKIIIIIIIMKLLVWLRNDKTITSVHCPADKLMLIFLNYYFTST